MNNTSNAPAVIYDVLNWLFGLLALAIGLINTFWGNDPGFGLFIMLLSLAFYPPVNILLKKMVGFAIPGLVKALLALFILWVSLGVGELFDKVELMLLSFK
ncbi:hypothetical protein [Hymenobacter sp. B81]|uniref:hypothetical protein n=1 Tax=Hymenobacter sp. B81 TaxID=3344878 RepID=UPI0037DDA37E